MQDRLSRLLYSALCALALAGCGHGAPGTASAAASAAAAGGSGIAAGAVASAAPPTDQQKSGCQSAAAGVLGQGAEVLACGFLNGRDVLEAVAIRRQHRSDGKEHDVYASRLVILRQEKSGWARALDAAQGIRNTVGYLATDFLDDNASFWAYRVQLHNTLPDDTRRQLTVDLAVMHDERDAWAVGTEVSWDRRVGRFREYSLDPGTPGFQAENRNPRQYHHVEHKGSASAAAHGST
jgi:hypothetical protein